MAPENEVRAFYDDFSRRIQRGDFRNLNARLEAIKGLCDAYLFPGARVLEIGCGSGIVSRHMLTRGARLLALDLSETNILTARRFAGGLGGEFLALDIVADADRLGDKGLFDAVLLADVIEHIPPAERPSLFRLIEEVLTPEGVVLLTWPSSEYQSYLRAERPETLQVVDETVELADLLAETTLQPIYYRLCDIWCRRQYIHLVLSRRQPFVPQELPKSRLKRLVLKMRNRLWRWRNRSLFRGGGDGD